MTKIKKILLSTLGISTILVGAGVGAISCSCGNNGEEDSDGVSFTEISDMQDYIVANLTDDTLEVHDWSTGDAKNPDMIKWVTEHISPLDFLFMHAYYLSINVPEFFSSIRDMSKPIFHSTINKEDLKFDFYYEVDVNDSFVYNFNIQNDVRYKCNIDGTYISDEDVYPLKLDSSTNLPIDSCSCGQDSQTDRQIGPYFDGEDEVLAEILGLWVPNLPFWSGISFPLK